MVAELRRRRHTLPAMAGAFTAIGERIILCGRLIARGLGCRGWSPPASSYESIELASIDELRDDGTPAADTRRADGLSDFAA